MTSTIIDIHGREIIDSRGNPTVEVDVMLEDGDQITETQGAVDLLGLLSAFASSGDKE